ncbi:MAG: arginine repressor [Lachnospiraceae bacterium]
MKIKRQQEIEKILNLYKIETQTDLANHLTNSGFKVTQATVSRDIKEMRLIKKTDEFGIHHYVLPNEKIRVLDEKYRRILREGYISMECAGNLLVIKTVSGMAMAVATAIDAMGLSEIVGSIAGDDTIMVAIKTIESTELVQEKMKELLL